MCQALDDTDEDAVRDALANLFPKYVTPPVGSSSKAGLATLLRQGNGGVGVRLGSLGVAAPGQVRLKETRAYGGAASCEGEAAPIRRLSDCAFPLRCDGSRRRSHTTPRGC
jgi:hypothetical protein